jgi:DNA mismatch repair protein MutL
LIRLSLQDLSGEVPSIQVDGTFNPFSNETPSKQFLVIKTRSTSKWDSFVCRFKTGCFDVEQVTLK